MYRYRRSCPRDGFASGSLNRTVGPAYRLCPSRVRTRRAHYWTLSFWRLRFGRWRRSSRCAKETHASEYDRSSKEALHFPARISSQGRRRATLVCRCRYTNCPAGPADPRLGEDLQNLVPGLGHRTAWAPCRQNEASSAFPRWRLGLQYWVSMLMLQKPVPSRFLFAGA